MAGGESSERATNLLYLVFDGQGAKGSKNAGPKEGRSKFCMIGEGRTSETHVGGRPEQVGAKCILEVKATTISLKKNYVIIHPASGLVQINSINKYIYLSCKAEVPV